MLPWQRETNEMEGSTIWKRWGALKGCQSGLHFNFNLYIQSLIFDVLQFSNILGLHGNSVWVLEYRTNALDCKSNPAASIFFLTQELHQQYYEERTEIECKIKLNFYKNARIACIQKHCIFLDGLFTGYSIQLFTTMSPLNK